MDSLSESVESAGAAEFVASARRGLWCWRGVSLDSTGGAPDQGVLTTHPDRRPRSMSIELSRACDDWFEERFGWRARSNHSLFVSGSRDQAMQFGTPVVVIPMTPARYVWSPRIADLTRHLEALGVLQAEQIPTVLEAGGYRDADLEAAIVSGHEIMVRAERYCWSAVPVV